MNVTMPAPAPTAPSAAAPNDRVVTREQSTTSSTRNTTRNTGRRGDDERTFGEQLDEVAVALAATIQPVRNDVPTKPHPTGPTGDAATVVAAPPATTAPTSESAAVLTPADTALAPPPVALIAPMITEIEGPPAPASTTPNTPVPGVISAATTDLAATDLAPTSTLEAPATATPGPAPVENAPPNTAQAAASAAQGQTLIDDVAATTSEPVTTADADTPLPLTAPTAPADTSTSTTSAGSDGGADRSTPQTPLAAGESTLDAAVDVTTDIAADVDNVDLGVADTTPPPALVTPGSTIRSDNNTSAAGVDGTAPLIAEGAEELPPPMRLAPPRTISVDLNDEGLGPLRVIATTEQRTVHLTVSAGEAIVRDALVRQQADLRDDLADAGLQLGSFEVDARAADRGHTDQPAVTGDRDRPTTRSAGGSVATNPIHDTTGADGRLDLRL